jgi:hypothetical protein
MNRKQIALGTTPRAALEGVGPMFLRAAAMKQSRKLFHLYFCILLHNAP